MGLVIVGAVLLAAGVGLFVGHRFKLASADKLRAMESRSAGDLQQLAGEIAAELGSGAFEETAQLVGNVECDRPLSSPLGQRPCVYYTMNVRYEYEEEYWTKDSSTGNQVRRTRRGSDTVANNTEGCPFRLNDGTGSLLVDPGRAKFDGLTQTVSRFDPSMGGGLLSYGGWSLSFNPMASGSRRPLGYRYEEHVLPLDLRLTVMGTINDKMGQLALRSTDKDKLIISTRSREELVASARKTATILLVIGIVLALVGVGLLIGGLVS